MPDTDPIISDDDAATLFEIEDEIRLHERSLEAANIDRANAREMLADALKRRAKFTRGLKEKLPLFETAETE